MNKLVRYSLMAALLTGVGLVGSASAQDEDSMRAPIIHPMNERGADRFVKSKGINPEDAPTGRVLAPPPLGRR